MTWLKKGLPESIAEMVQKRLSVKTYCRMLKVILKTIGKRNLIDGNLRLRQKNSRKNWSQLNSLGDVLNKFEKEIPKVLEELEENEAVRKNILQQFSTLTAFTEKDLLNFFNLSRLMKRLSLPNG